MVEIPVWLLVVLIAGMVGTTTAAAAPYLRAERLVDRILARELRPARPPLPPEAPTPPDPDTAAWEAAQHLLDLRTEAAQDWAERQAER